LDFVTEQLEGGGARQGHQIEKHALAKGNFAGHGARLGEDEGGGRVGGGEVFRAKIIWTLVMARAG